MPIDTAEKEADLGYELTERNVKEGGAILVSEEAVPADEAPTPGM